MRTAWDNGKGYLQPECCKPPLPPPSPTDKPMSSNDKVITFLLFVNRVQLQHVCSSRAAPLAPGSWLPDNTRLNQPLGVEPPALLQKIWALPSQQPVISLIKGELECFPSSQEAFGTTIKAL